MRCGLEYLEEGIQLLSPIHVRWKKLAALARYELIFKKWGNSFRSQFGGLKDFQRETSKKFG